MNRNGRAGAHATLWGAGGALRPELAAYTVGDDRLWDRRLVRWDIYGTLAHVDGLAAAGVLGVAEREALRTVLGGLLVEEAAGALTVGEEDEDVHTTLERILVERLGETGAKVHTGRSRNDQVLVDLRLYAKDRLLTVMDGVVDLIAALVAYARRHRGVVWPGYTHQRRAMPSTVGAWAAGFAEGLLDGLGPLAAALDLVDRSPLGSAAGYGVPLPLDRGLVARALGFAGAQWNVTAVQASRGRVEGVVLAALWAVASDLAKLAWDVILFTAPEYGFLRIPAGLATGSSIMPQKVNPDVFELTRGRAGVVAGCLGEVMAVAGSLPSGYHRDLQLTKGPLMRGIDAADEAVVMMCAAVPQLEVDAEACSAAVDAGMLATDEVLRRVGEGLAFRDAYRSVAAELAAGVIPPVLGADDILASRQGPGTVGNPSLEPLGVGARRWRRRVRDRRRRFRGALEALAAEGSR